MVRRIIQALTALLYNIHLKGFITGRIYQGSLKKVCVPGLNCYSCPGAVGSCPIGSLQSSINAVKYKVSLYVAGLLILFGSILGRFICGWACPFGLVQEVLHKIPSPKLRKKPVFGVLKYGKYVILAVFVLLLPALYSLQKGVTIPAFCKYICPAGTLEAGIPLIALNESLRYTIGWLFYWKMLLLTAMVLSAVFIYRPFCRFVCPLGAIYAMFNSTAIFGLKVDSAKCTHCGICTGACKVDIHPFETPNDPECVRCGDCIKACPHSALKFSSVYTGTPCTSRNVTQSK
ncbi:MAG TPA: 4Fe-4S binding protein [Clostridiales bacterium]|nr:4Fe-4S binding protein [Clostridiales bacterium]